MRQQGIVGIFVLLILALAIAGGAYYFGRVSAKPQVDQAKQEVTSTTRTPDPTADWQVYKSDLGFSVRYPQGWAFKESKETTYYKDGRRESVVVDLIESDIVAEQERRIPSFVRISVTADPGFDLMNLSDMKDIFPVSGPTWEDITVGGTNALRVSHLGCLSGDCLNVFIKKGDTVFDISVPEQAREGRRLEFFDQILSTFKFTN